MTEIERRQCKRYKTSQNAFAVFRPNYHKLGKIKNIGKGGLLFEYIDLENPEKDVEKGFEREIDIFNSQGNFYLPRIPCKFIHNSEVIHNHSFITSIHMRRCGIQFEELTQKDADSLVSFLAHYES